MWPLILEAALLLNPAFDVYRIFDMVHYVLPIHIPLPDDTRVTLAPNSLGRPWLPVSHRVYINYFCGLTPCAQKWHICPNTGEPGVFQPPRRQSRDPCTGERTVDRVQQLPRLCRVR